MESVTKAEEAEWTTKAAISDRYEPIAIQESSHDERSALPSYDSV